MVALSTDTIGFLTMLVIKIETIHELAITASLGVGCFDPQRDHDAAAFFKRVDDALYLAKGMGRNRLQLA